MTTNYRIFIAIFALILSGCVDDSDEVPVVEADVDEETGWEVEEEQQEESEEEQQEESADGSQTESIQAISTESAQPFDILDCTGPDLSEDCAGELVVHEWGTFTSVQSSKGEYLEGLHHEEEALPYFVHRFGYSGVDYWSATKGLDFLPEPVTQKMETPVIYFYTDGPRTVDVSVEFPEGVISEWYPDAVSQHSPQLMEIADGGMDWSVDLTNEPGAVPMVAEDDIWVPSRQVPDAAWVEYADEREKFIFYRGVGTFEPPVSVFEDGESYEVANFSSDTIPEAYLLEVDDQQGQIHSLGDVSGFDSVEFNPETDAVGSPQSVDGMVEDAKSLIHDGLVDTGLTDDEAQAMVDTWADSYFRTPGNRVLYILPDNWTEDLLPIQVDPQPDEMVRTLVGRVEVITESEEDELVTEITEAYNDPDISLLDLADQRFSEPRLRRGCQLVEDDIQQWCEPRLHTLKGEFRVSVTW